MDEAKRLRTTKNEWGTAVAHFRCATCGEEFSITPAPETDKGWTDCGARECASYDERRDVSKWFEEGRVKAVPDPDGSTRLVPYRVIDGGKEGE